MTNTDTTNLLTFLMILFLLPLELVNSILFLNLILGTHPSSWVLEMKYPSPHRVSEVR
jgi:hypothetical protein